MALIEVVEEEQAPPEVRAIYDKGRAASGLVMEAWKGNAHNPPVLEGYMHYVQAIFKPGPLDQRTKDLVALRICYLNQCLYSLSHRVHAARRQGLPEPDIAAVVDPANHDFTSREQAALAFAEELTLNVATVSYADGKQAVGAGTVTAVKAHFSDAEINDLAVSVGLWNLLTRYHRVMDFDLDMAKPPPPLDISGA
jgi:uncharacterized peroxidase-related enzyme